MGVPPDSDTVYAEVTSPSSTVSGPLMLTVMGSLSSMVAVEALAVVLT